MQHKLGGNSMYDRMGNKYFIRMGVYGRTQNIEYASRYSFLENLEYYNKQCPDNILSFSNTDSTNVDSLHKLPDNVITENDVYKYCAKHGKIDWLR